jgi:hypothetical protein
MPLPLYGSGFVGADLRGDLADQRLSAPEIDSVVCFSPTLTAIPPGSCT